MNYLKHYSESDLTCQYGNCKKTGKWQRQYTNYHDDKSNWACFCPQHQIEADEYWKEMWKEYYSNIL